MAIITFPQAISPTKSTWGIKSNAEIFTSPLNGTVQTAGRLGSRWKATIDYPPMTLATGVAMEAFLAQMDGFSGRCYVTPHHRPGTGLNANVNGAGQVGTVLNLSGVAANRIFNAGDYFSVNGEFKMVTQTAQATSGGLVALSFMPMLRASPTNGAAVTFTNPTVQMMLSADEYLLTRAPGSIYEPMSISLIEVFQ